MGYVDPSRERYQEFRDMPRKGRMSGQSRQRATAGRPIERRRRCRLADMSTSGGLGALEDALRRDLELLDFPKRPWVLPRSTVDGRRVLDVLIIGGGQGGLSIAFGLQRERVDNLLIVDESPIDREGPWRTFARMITLRTPKHVTGPDWGIPSLTIRAWYEAQHGAGSWQRMGLIPKETWAEYLAWYRRFHAIPVRKR